MYWRECATNFCLNTGYHQFAIGLGDYKDKARRVESPSFVNYSVKYRGNSYNDKVFSHVHLIIQHLHHATNHMLIKRESALAASCDAVFHVIISG
ncbi:hypothetical protein Tco_0251050 [Tanacetum coccineum]